MIPLSLFASLGGCAPLNKHEAPAPSAPQATRFAVLVPNLFVSAPPELSGATDRVLGQITRYLAAQGRERQVVEALEARSLWLASTAEAEQLDAESRNFHGAMKIFARKLGAEREFDALVVPSLVYREGQLANRVVKWDGVVRRLPTVGEDSKPIPMAFETSVPVVSLHLMVFDADGERIFERYGGLDLVHSLSLDPSDESQLRVDLRHPMLGERSFLRDGVEVAFDPYLPRDRVDEW